MYILHIVQKYISMTNTISRLPSSYIHTSTYLYTHIFYINIYIYIYMRIFQKYSSMSNTISHLPS